MKLNYPFPSIGWVDFYSNILLLQVNSVKVHHPAAKSCFQGSFEALETKNTEAFFCTYFLSHLRFQKIKDLLFLFVKERTRPLPIGSCEATQTLR